MNNTFVIASSKPWNSKLPERLQFLTGHNFQLINYQEDLTVENLAKIDPRFVFFPHWSYRIPDDVFQSFECVIFHMTDLPFGRGGSPLQNLIARGIYETKISALRCVEVLDAGPIYLKRPLSLYGSGEEIYIRASNIVEDMIVEIVRDNPKPLDQVGEPTFFKRRRPDQGKLEATQTLDQAFDLIRMLDAEGYPHAFIDIGNFRLEFTRANRRSDRIVADVSITLVDQKNSTSN